MALALAPPICGCLDVFMGVRLVFQIGAQHPSGLFVYCNALRE